jgi:hypothetical protein
MIRIEGHFRTKLKFEWHARINDAFTGQWVVVDNSVKINPLEAYLLRTVLRQRYTVEVVLRSEGKTKRVPLDGQKAMKRRRAPKNLTRSISLSNFPCSRESLFEPQVAGRIGIEEDEF